MPEENKDESQCDFEIELIEDPYSRDDLVQPTTITPELQRAQWHVLSIVLGLSGAFVAVICQDVKAFIAALVVISAQRLPIRLFPRMSIRHESN